jgi:FMN phosphatase YigB (HAD superfamily)
MIKAVLYDLGDIFFEAHFWRRWMWKEIMKITGKRWTFREFYDLYESWLKSVYEGNTGYKENHLNFLRSMDLVDPVKFMDESFKKKKYFEENRKLFPGVKKTLKKLKDNRIMNVIMTDNEKTAALLREEVLQKFLIDYLIDKVYTSCELGITKPDPLFFSYILSDLKLHKKEVIFMGHDKDEIDGAKKNGIKVIEFNNYLRNKTDADFRIARFSLLPETILSLQPA